MSSKAMDDKGYFFWEPAPMLAVLLTLQENDDGTTLVQTVYQPTEEEVVDICLEHDLNFDTVLEILRSKEDETHTMVIDVKKFKAANP